MDKAFRRFIQIVTILSVAMMGQSENSVASNKPMHTVLLI